MYDKSTAFNTANDNTMLISEKYPDVRSLTFEVVAEWYRADDNYRASPYSRLGQKWTLRPDDRTLFFDQCHFSQCYGPLSGFDYHAQIDEMIRSRRTEATFRVDCGGKGDRALQYSCDNYIEFKVVACYK